MIALGTTMGDRTPGTTRRIRVAISGGLVACVFLAAATLAACDKKEDAKAPPDELDAACEKLESLLSHGGESGNAAQMAECKRELKEMSETCGDELLTCVAEAKSEDAAMSCLLSCAFQSGPGGDGTSSSGGQPDAPRLPDRPPPRDK